MQATTGKLKRIASASVFALLLVAGGLSACGPSARGGPASIGASSSPTSASDCDEGCRALQRQSATPTSECDEGSRAAARMGITVRCRSD